MSICRIHQFIWTSVANAYTLCAVDVQKADGLISDSLSGTLLRKSELSVGTEGSGWSTVAVSALSDSFSRGDRIDINAMKDKGLVPADALKVRVIAEGRIDKPLTVKANEFSPTAIKMIALTGGEAVRITTTREKNKK